ncbi:MAG TPA: oxygen-independent coproporphyrinogen III oxidase-like protein [Chromatiales bacterium]|nr:oxygen-independent coproporphyrinogen III oxidase-like protein [Thiotrichales bacterium]HIP67028.1 oxygen-independent coproporphyrinogen III oxidase-like protein [Chromatiales bacterium]
MSFNFTTPIPLSLYIHLPWCVKKCPYCDFNSYALRDDLPEQAYVDALLADLEQELPKIWGRRLESIFLGGGTPSLFSPEAIDRLLSGVRRLLPARRDIEITLEANPGTFEQTKFSEFRSAGINRLSIGIQSFNPEHLKVLGRIHDDKEAKLAAEVAHRAGFENFNLDLMFGLPGQRIESSQLDLQTAIDLKPTHISFYQLTLEPNTEFHVHPPQLPDDESIWQMQLEGQGLLASTGYQQYEISAYARPHHQCHHNLNYWEFGDYIGIGAGAHGKITDPASSSISRYWKPRQPQQYLDQASSNPTENHRHLSEKEAIFEFMLNALRLTNGFSADLFSERTGLPWETASKLCESSIADSLLQKNNRLIQPTTLGRRFLDNLTGRFLPDD